MDTGTATPPKAPWIVNACVADVPAALSTLIWLEAVAAPLGSGRDAALIGCVAGRLDTLTVPIADPPPPSVTVGVPEIATPGVPEILTVPPTLSAPPPIRASSDVSLTGSLLLAETGLPPSVIVTDPLDPPEPPPLKLHGCTWVPLGQKIVTPG
jgi:hypothetical protein